RVDASTVTSYSVPLPLTFFRLVSVLLFLIQISMSLKGLKKQLQVCMHEIFPPLPPSSLSLSLSFLRLVFSLSHTNRHVSACFAHPTAGSESPRQHTQMVFEKLIFKCPAQQISVVAHGTGCMQAMHLLRSNSTNSPLTPLSLSRALSL